MAIEWKSDLEKGTWFAQSGAAGVHIHALPQWEGYRLTYMVSGKIISQADRGLHEPVFEIAERWLMDKQEGSPAYTTLTVQITVRAEDVTMCKEALVDALGGDFGAIYSTREEAALPEEIEEYETNFSEEF